MSDATHHKLNRLDGLQIRELLGPVAANVEEKFVDHLTWTARRFIAHSPFLVMATSSSEGADASPRGDGPGFVRVLDTTTLSIPDRSGNAVADSFRNVLENPAVGLLFLVPGFRETLRVNGDAFITDDESLMRRHELDGRIPKMSMVVNVCEVYFHCAKSILRSGVWDSSTFPAHADVLPGGNVFSMSLLEQKEPSATSASVSAELEDVYLTTL